MLISNKNAPVFFNQIADLGKRCIKIAGCFGGRK
jgi:hypothetical protein